MDYISFFLSLSVLLIALIKGVRMGQMGMALMSAIALCLLSFFLDIPPSKPPYDVLIVIMSVVTAASALEAAGSLQMLISYGHYILCRYPTYIVWITPFLVYALTWVTGTSHVTYAFFPVIAAVSRKAGIRPERALSGGVIASQLAILASPLSAASAIIDQALSGADRPGYRILWTYTWITLCATGVVAGVASRLGRDDDWDRGGEEEEGMGKEGMGKEGMGKEKPSYDGKAWGALAIFFGAILAIILLNIFSDSSKYMNAVVMFSAAGVMMLFCGVEGKVMTGGKIFLSGMRAVVTISCISSLGATFLASQKELLGSWVSEIDGVMGWWGLFFVTTLLTSSQGATLGMLLPLAKGAGLSSSFILAVLPAAGSFYILPGYPTMTAAVDFDKSGSTRLGMFHSFLLPGLAGTVTVCLLSYLVFIF